MGKYFKYLMMYLVEEDLNLREPVHLKRYLIIAWILIGGWMFYQDFKKYYIKMS